MQKILLSRLVMIAGLMLLLLLPLSMIHGVVAERQNLQVQVEQTIAMSLAGPQRLAGPILVVPYVLQQTSVSTDDAGRTIRKSVDRHMQAVFMPDHLNIEATTGVEARQKGIYSAMVHRTQANMRARFVVPAQLGVEHAPGALTVGRPWIAIGLTDVRGLRAAPVLSWDKQPKPMQQGTRVAILGDGLHAMVELSSVQQPGAYDVEISLDVVGTGSLSVAPLGVETVMQMTAAWPHPNFSGRFLPHSRSIDASGFRARWEVSGLASSNDAQIKRMVESDKADSKLLEAFDVTFIEPVNIYQQSERAVKYGILFVVLTFATLFLLEVLTGHRVHPMQYGLVGLALAMFFLLLVSLSEHMRFVLAYLAASSACVILIGYYLTRVLASRRRAAIFSAQLAVLYAVLYALLLSEDNALLLGSLLLFAVLAAVMALTRQVDWYQFGANETTSTAETSNSQSPVAVKS